jgi:hypothetical protein
MCWRRGWNTLAPVDGRTTTIRMELRRDGDLPSGRACDDHGRVKDFTGWVGLVAAIDQLLSVDDGPGAKE